MCCIDQGTGRRLGEKACQGGDGHYEADAGLVPVANREQVSGEIRSQPAAHIGKKEIQRVEGAVRACQSSGILVFGHGGQPALDTLSLFSRAAGAAEDRSLVTEEEEAQIRQACRDQGLPLDHPSFRALADQPSIQ